MELQENFSNPELTNLYLEEKYTGVLLYGPAGTGKTLFAETFAAESGFSYIPVQSEFVLDNRMGMQEKNMAAVLHAAEEQQPVVIFIDEADKFLDPGSGESSADRMSLINVFKERLSALQEAKAIIGEYICFSRY